MQSNKAKILLAATELFLEGGVNALSVRAIASRAGVSTIGIYSHFEGKQGILDALYIEGFDAVKEAMKVLDKTANSKQAVRMAAKNYLQFAVKSEAHYRLIFAETGANYTPSAQARSAGVSAFEEFTKVIAHFLPQQSTIKRQQDVALQFWSLLHGSVSLRGHAVADLVNMKSWESRVMVAVDYLIEGVEAT